MKWSTSKASFVAAWSFSSSLTMPRQESDDRTSVGRKCLRANVHLPDPLGPIRTTRDSLGMVMFMLCLFRLPGDCAGIYSTSSNRL